MMGHKGLLVWTPGLVVRVIQLIWTLEKTFVSYLSITWIVTHWIQGNKRILAVTRITCITPFLFISRSVWPISRNPVSMGLRANRSDKNTKFINVQAACVNGCTNQLLNGLISWITKVVYLCINFSHYVDQRINDPFFQTNSP